MNKYIINYNISKKGVDSLVLTNPASKSTEYSQTIVIEKS